MSGDDPSPENGPAQAPVGPAPPRRARRIGAWIAGAVGIVLTLVALAIGTVFWSVHHAGASAWLLSLVPGLTVVDPQGSLIGDFSATRLVYVVGDAGELRLEAPRWHALAATGGDRGRWLRLAIDTLHADRAVWVANPTPRPSQPATIPASLRLPLEIEVREASVGELRIGSVEAMPIRGVRAHVHLGADGGARHRVDSLAAAIDRGNARGALAIGADPPFAVEATVDAVASASAGAAPNAGTAPNTGAAANTRAAPSADAAASAADGAAAMRWSATARAVGPLAALATSATARVAASATHAAQSLDARALIRPFAPWPLGELHASASSLDLSAFATGVPATALTGEATVTTTGIDAPALVSVDLANARAGRWNEGFLPVRRLRAELRARPQQPDVVDIGELSAELGSQRGAAGSIVGSGRWTPATWSLDAELRAVRPAALDARAADAIVAGKVAIGGSGFASAPATSAVPAAVPRVELSADLAGELTDARLPRAAPKSARVRLDARAGANDIELRRFEASLGDARATLAGRLARKGASEPWRATGRAELARFDPAPWWPGSTDSLLARGANTINAKGEFDLLVSPERIGDDLYAALAATTGNASLAVVDSVVAGVAVHGNARFANADGRARPGLDLVAGGNRIQLEGTIAARGASNDDWRVLVDAPRLDALAPLVATSPRAGAVERGPPPLAGSLALRAHLAGRWPSIASDGELQAAALAMHSVRIRQASGRWRVGSGADAAVAATLALEDVDVDGRALGRVDTQVSGTGRAHRAELRIASALLPPAWTDAFSTRPSGDTVAPPESATIAASAPPLAAGATSRSRSVVSIVAEGGLVDIDGHRAGGWRGSLRELVARSTAAPPRVWVSARDVRGSVLWAGAPLRVSVDPGTAEVLGASLRWSRVAWQQGDGRLPARLDAQATVDAIAVAPILQALQPGFGWGGDLRVGARLKVQSGPSVGVDVVVERAGGDLSVTDEISTQSLGLSDLRLGIAAEGGVWHFTAAAAGATLGVVSAAVSTRTSSKTMWPGPDARLEGVSELRVDNLGTWGSWLTPGWRLGGRLHASASFSGRFGAPEYTGHVEGEAVTVRNFIEGVNVIDGTIAIALQGTTARIETFTAKGGTGTLRLEGDAAFSDAPTAQLRLAIDRFEVLGRVDRRIVASGAAAMRLDARTLGLDGAFRIDEGLVDFTRSDAPTLGDDVEVVRRPRAPAPAPGAAPRQAQVPVSDDSAAAAAPTPRRDVRLDLRVGMGDKLRVRGRGLDAGLRGEVRLTSPNGRLAVAGTLSTVEGTYQAYGQKLDIDRGVLTFVGPVENPRLDIEATRPNLDVRVGVTVSGTALNPRIRLFSEPELSDIDKLSWLVLGRASSTTGGADTALLQQAALALLSGEGPGVTDRIFKSIGLDEVSVRQTQGAVNDTIVSLGKQISKRWYVGYERGLNTTLGTWQLIYRVAQRVTVRAETGSDNAVDVIWTWRWK